MEYIEQTLADGIALGIVEESPQGGTTEDL